MVTVPPRGLAWHGNRGFSLVELTIATAIAGAVLGAAVVLAQSIQTAYSHELNSAAVEQEARLAMDWITRTVAGAGSNPYNISIAACRSPGSPFTAFILDPNGDGLHNDIRVQADINPPNGLLAGTPGACIESGEDVTITHDPVTQALTRRDVAVNTPPMPVTDGVFAGLRFTYLTADRNLTSAPAEIAYVRVNLTARSRSRDPRTNLPVTFSYESEVRVRSR